MSLMSILDGMEDDEGYNIARVNLNGEKTSNLNNVSNGADEASNDKMNEQGRVKEEQEKFDPNKMFNIGERNKTYGNPFSQDELESLAVQMQEQGNPDNAQSINIPDNKTYEENIKGNNTTVVAEEDGLGFEIVDPNNNETKDGIFSIDASGIESNEILVSDALDKAPVLQTTQKSLTEETNTQLNDVATNAQEMFSRLGEHSKEINARDLAENFNPNAVITETLEDSVIVVEESDQIIENNLDNGGIVVIDDSLDESKEYDYVAQMEKNLGKEHTQSKDDYHNQVPPLDYDGVQNYEQQSDHSYNQEQNQQGEEQHQNNSLPVQNSGIGLPMYTTPFGNKLYIPRQSKKEVKTTNPYILDFLGSELTDVDGEVLVVDAKIIPYGNKGDTRVEWELLTKDLYPVTASQFTLKNEITQEELNQFLKQVIYVNGKVSSFKNNKQLTINLVDMAKNVKLEDFKVSDEEIIPVDYEIETYKDWYRFLTSTMKSNWIPAMLNLVLVRSGNLERILKASASSSVHDSGAGGLFKHTMKVSMNAYNIAQVYPHLNSDIMVGSALVHDLGKLIEISNKKYTKEGDLNGHIVIGYTMVRESINKLINDGMEIDPDEVSNLLHCILSHHGTLEWGSPVVPKTREAMALHLCDMIDARLTHMSETLGDSEKGYSKTFKSSVYDLN